MQHGRASATQGPLRGSVSFHANLKNKLQQQWILVEYNVRLLA